MKGFFSEIKRLDAKATEEPSSPVFFFPQHEGGDDFDEDECELTYEERLAYINQTIAGKMALELSDSKNNFVNNNLWDLYYDDFDDNNWQGRSYTQDELAMCLAILEKDNVLSFEAQKNAVISDDADVTEAFEKAQMDYRKKIIHECYENGTFETERWRVAIRYL